MPTRSELQQDEKYFSDGYNLVMLHDATKITHEICCSWMHETMKSVLFSPLEKNNAVAMDEA